MSLSKGESDMTTIRRASSPSFSRWLLSRSPLTPGDLHRVKHRDHRDAGEPFLRQLLRRPALRARRAYSAGRATKGDHGCVDGLTCSSKHELSPAATRTRGGPQEGRLVHLKNYLPGPTWTTAGRQPLGGELQESGAHTVASPNDGFVRSTTPPSSRTGGREPDRRRHDGYYNQDDLPFYYGLAQTFAISDRYFSSVLGQTFPNRSYELAATSFGHLTTMRFSRLRAATADHRNDHGPARSASLSWIDFFSDLPTAAIFRIPDFPQPRLFGTRRWNRSSLPLREMPPKPTPCALPAVSFVDPVFGFFDPLAENDEHPPTDIRKGQSFVSMIVNALRASSWLDDSILSSRTTTWRLLRSRRSSEGEPGRGAQSGRDRPGQCADASTSRRAPSRAAVRTGNFSAPWMRPPSARVHAHRTLPGVLRQLRSARVPRAVRGRIAVLRPHYVSHEVADHNLAAGVQSRSGS